MEKLIQTIFTGLQLGSIYALIAIGYTMVYGIVRIINFAHGDLLMVGGYSLLWAIPFLRKFGFSGWVAIPATLLFCVVVGVATEVLAYAPARKTKREMAPLIMAMGLSLMLQNVAQYYLRVSGTLYGAVVPSFLPTGRVKVLGVYMSWTTPLTIVVGILSVTILQLVVNKTHVGRAMRAVAQDKEAVALVGIDSEKVIRYTFGIGAALAAVASCMWFSIYPGTSPHIGTSIGLFAFVAAVLGGIGSLTGAMVGGFLIGIIYSFTVSYISSSMSETVVFVTLVAVLLIRPQGIFGKNRREKV